MNVITGPIIFAYIFAEFSLVLQILCEENMNNKEKNKTVGDIQLGEI